MKKNLMFLVCLMLFATITPIQAQIDNLTNVSAEWVRIGSRNAATDAADAMAYNPGGMSRLSSGFHVNVGNQSFFRKPSHSYDLGYGSTEYSQDGNDMFVPNLYMSYNKNKWAAFGGVYIAGGGATAKYPTGSFTTDLVSFSTLGYLQMNGMGYTHTVNSNLEGNSYYMAYTLGGAYSINEKFSFGVMVRNISAKNTTKIGTTAQDATGTYPDMPFALNTESTASGIGVMIGAHFKPIEAFSVAIRYESQTKLEFETNQITDDFGLTVDGEKSNRDLPAVLGIGLSYQLNSKAKLVSDFNYYFQENADWGSTIVDPENGIYEEVSKLAGDASSYSLGLEYAVNTKWMLSLGGAYTMFNYNNQDLYYTIHGNYETVMDDNLAFCTGVAFNPTEKVRINLGFMKAIYNKDKELSYDALATKITVNNSISTVAVGVDFTF